MYILHTYLQPFWRVELDHLYTPRIAAMNLQNFCSSLLLLLLFGVASAKELVVSFPDRGPTYPTGTITLRQDSAAGLLTITTALTRLENAVNGNEWHSERHRRMEIFMRVRFHALHMHERTRAGTSVGGSGIACA